ncbi:unnamed protein product, partial [Discosporangium mesarthrocarpum]
VAETPANSSGSNGVGGELHRLKASLEEYLAFSSPSSVAQKAEGKPTQSKARVAGGGGYGAGLGLSGRKIQSIYHGHDIDQQEDNNTPSSLPSVVRGEGEGWRGSAIPSRLLGLSKQELMALVAVLGEALDYTSSGGGGGGSGGGLSRGSSNGKGEHLPSSLLPAAPPPVQHTAASMFNFSGMRKPLSV